MSYEEYKRKDKELADQYNEYLADCAEHEIQIGINHREMARITTNRSDLSHEYSLNS